MTAREDYGEPLGGDLLLEIGTLYLRRGLLPMGVRAFLSCLDRKEAADLLRTLVIELDGGH